MWTFRAGLIGLALLAGLDWYGSVSTSSYRDAPRDSTWQATSALQHATVVTGGRRCDQWTGTRFNCGEASWNWVGRHIGRINVDDRVDKRDCLWIHPRDGGKNQIIFDAVPLESQITGYVGLLNSANKGKPVTVKITVAGKAAKQVFLTDRSRGWSELNIDTSSQLDTTAEVSIELHTKAAEWRHVCVQLTIQDTTTPRREGLSLP